MCLCLPYKYMCVCVYIYIYIIAGETGVKFLVESYQILKNGTRCRLA